MRCFAKMAAFGFAVGFGVLGWAAPPERSVGIDVIQAYQGTWEVSIDHLDTAQSKASHEKTTLHNDCWKSGGYFACNQYVDGDSKVLLVFTFDAVTKEYRSYQVPPNGGDPGGPGKLVIDGNVWTFPWETGDAEKKTYFRVVNVFQGADRIEFRQEFSTDKAHWTVTARGSEVRTAPK